MGVTQAVKDARANSGFQTTVGGPLDQAAADATTTAKETSKGWLGWIVGGKKSE